MRQRHKQVWRKEQYKLPSIRKPVQFTKAHPCWNHKSSLYSLLGVNPPEPVPTSLATTATYPGHQAKATLGSQRCIRRQ